MVEPTQEQIEALEVITEYRMELEELYGLFMDVALALPRNRLHLKEIFPSGANLKAPFLYGQGNPSDPNAEFQHRTSIGAVLDRNSADGQNTIILSRSIVISVYTLWEDHCRKRIESILGLESNSVVSPLFGDVGKYRHSIAHNKSRLKRQTEVLDFFQKGELINLDKQKMYTLFHLITDELSRICRKYTNFDIPLNLSRKLY